MACLLRVMLVALVIACSFNRSANAETYSIEQVKGNVYRFVNDRHRSVLMVTEEGIIVTDPMNAAAAKWLKNELKQRFNKPVRYVIYSHNHSDHVYGAEVFKEPGVDFVSHILAQQDLLRTRANTVIPNITFGSKMNIRLGDSEVELRYHGPNDGRGSISMLFKPAKVIYVTDWIVLGRMPWQKLWSYDIQGMINSTQEVLDLDFDILVGGHADIGRKEQVRDYLTYLDTLYSTVIDGIHNGRSLPEMKKNVRLDRYKHLANYEEWLPLNIEGVYRRLMEESGMGGRSDIVQPKSP